MIVNKRKRGPAPGYSAVMSGEFEHDRRDLRASHEDRDQAVEQLRIAAGDGRLTPEELDERIEAAMSARTYGELEKVLQDLPGAVPSARPMPAAPMVPGGAPAVKDVVELHSRHGNIQRNGPWAVPLRLDIETRSGTVVLDFTEAVVSHPTLDISVAIRSGNLVLVLPPDIAVDTDNVSVRSGTIHQRAHRDGSVQPRLLITMYGHVRSGDILLDAPPQPGFLSNFRLGGPNRTIRWGGPKL
jgi:hypothetical protein